VPLVHPQRERPRRVLAEGAHVAGDGLGQLAGLRQRRAVIGRDEHRGGERGERQVGGREALAEQVRAPVGQGVDWWESAGVQVPVKPGDHVVFPASAGTWVEVDEERLLVCRITELLGIIETADEADSRSELGDELADL